MNKGLIIALILSITVNIYSFFQWLVNHEVMTSVTTHSSVVNAVNPSLYSPQSTSLYSPSNAPAKNTSANTAQLTKQIAMDNHAPTDDIAKQAMVYFHRADFYTAVDLYEQLFAENENKALSVRQAWRHQLDAWLVSQEYWLIEQFNQVYLLRFSDDLVFMQFEAERLIGLQKIAAGLSWYYDMLAYSDDDTQQLAWLNHIHQLAEAEFTRLAAEKKWQQLADFSETLSQLENQYSPYLLAHIKALAYLAEFEQAWFYLDDLLADPLYQAQASTLQQLLNRLQKGEQAIALNRVGTHFLVGAKIDNKTKVNLIIDTGASFTAVTERAFDDIRYYSDVEHIRDIEINTAGGMVTSPIYRVKSFALSGYQLNNFDIVVMELANLKADGLLGMNYLSHYRFEIDQSENSLYLKKR